MTGTIKKLPEVDAVEWCAEIGLTYFRDQIALLEGHRSDNLTTMRLFGIRDAEDLECRIAEMRRQAWDRYMNFAIQSDIEAERS